MITFSANTQQETFNEVFVKLVGRGADLTDAKTLEGITNYAFKVMDTVKRGKESKSWQNWELKRSTTRTGKSVMPWETRGYKNNIAKQEAEANKDLSLVTSVDELNCCPGIVADSIEELQYTVDFDRIAVQNDLEYLLTVIYRFWNHCRVYEGKDVLFVIEKIYDADLNHYPNIRNQFIKKFEKDFAPLIKKDEELQDVFGILIESQELRTIVLGDSPKYRTVKTKVWEKCMADFSNQFNIDQAKRLEKIKQIFEEGYVKPEDEDTF